MSNAKDSIISETQHLKIRHPFEELDENYLTDLEARRNEAKPNSSVKKSGPLDLMAAFNNKPAALDFIWPGFLAGTVGALIAPGATGKSFWALQAAMSISCEVPGGDLIALSPKQTGRVAYFAGEDPENVLLHRVHDIGQHLNSAAQVSIAEHLILESTMGECLDIMDDHKLERMIDDYAGYRLIIFDTLSRIHRLDENNNSEMAQVVSNLERLAVRTGASILYLHHVNKSSVREGQTGQQQAGRGASALVDNPRWCGYFAKMSQQESEQLTDRHFERSPIEERRKQFMRFGVSKQNYGEDLPDRWYQRHDGGVLLPVELSETKKSEPTRNGGNNLEGSRYNAV